MNATFNMFAKQVVRVQAIPFKISKNINNIEYLNKNELNKLYDKSAKKYSKAYKELTK